MEHVSLIRIMFEKGAFSSDVKRLHVFLLICRTTKFVGGTDYLPSTCTSKAKASSLPIPNVEEKRPLDAR